MLKTSHSLLAGLLVALVFCISTARAVPVKDANLQLWLDATDPTTLFQEISATPATPSANGDPVGAWLDKSGNGFHALANTNISATGQRPIRNDTALGGGPALRFDAVDDGMDVSNSLSVTRPYTFFLVDQYNGQITNGGSTLHGRTVDSRSINWLIGKHAGSNRHYANGWVAVGGTPGVDNVPVIGTALGNTSAPDSFYYINGTDFTTDTTPTGAPGLLRIGRGAIGTELSDFDISELVVYDRVLNRAEQTITENYLSAKYNIGISNDRYVGDNPGNGNYDSEVFGIGQFDGSNLVAVGNSGGLTIAEDGGTLDTGDWVLAGHNVALNGITGDDVSGIDVRMERVWYIDQTQEVDVTLTFDFSDAGLDPSLASAFTRLIYSSSDPFSFAALPLDPTIVGDQVSFNVPAGLLLDGYFTLSTAVPEPATGLLVMLAAVVFVRRRRRTGKEA